MRSAVTFAVAALAALGLPVAGLAQRVAPAATSTTMASLAGCDWQPIGQFAKLTPRGLAVTPDGGLLLTADDLGEDGHSTLVTLRWDGPGGSWQEVDRFLPATSAGTGARAIAVDADGNAFVLAWDQEPAATRLLLRRSLNGGAAGTWESSETTWTAQPGGDVAVDADGRVYVAHGYVDATGVGWRVESALRGIGGFTVEDDVHVTGASAAIPQDIATGPDGALYVAGQLDGAPDQWLVRGRGMGARKAAWQTLDRFTLTATSYGLVPRAVVPLGGRLLVAGLGVDGGGANDYSWVERWQTGRGKWSTRRYQLQPGLTTVAQDAVATAQGVAVLAIGYTSRGTTLVIRESTAAGRDPEVVLTLPQVTDLWAARLAIGADRAAVAAVVGGNATILGCTR